MKGLSAIKGLGETKEDSLKNSLEGRQFSELSQYAQNIGGRIQALPNGDAKKSFVDQYNKVATNITQMWNHWEWTDSPALFASEYKTDMNVLRYLDQQLAARTAEPTVVPETVSQPMQTIAPFTPSGGSVPLDPSSILWRTPSVAATVDSWPQTSGSPAADSSSFLKPILVILGVGVVGYVVFTQIKKRGGKR